MPGGLKWASASRFSAAMPGRWAGERAHDVVLLIATWCLTKGTSAGVAAMALRPSQGHRALAAAAGQGACHDAVPYAWIVRPVRHCSRVDASGGSCDSFDRRLERCKHKPPAVIPAHGASGTACCSESSWPRCRLLARPLRRPALAVHDHVGQRSMSMAQLQALPTHHTVNIAAASLLRHVGRRTFPHVAGALGSRRLWCCCCEGDLAFNWSQAPGLVSRTWPSLHAQHAAYEQCCVLRWSACTWRP